jgi:hypothetical protein
MEINLVASRAGVSVAEYFQSPGEIVCLLLTNNSPLGIYNVCAKVYPRTHGYLICAYLLTLVIWNLDVIIITIKA